MIDDPDAQKGLIATLTATLFAALGWYASRRIKKTDSMDARIQLIERTYISRAELAGALNTLNTNLEKLNDKLDRIK